MTTNLAVVILAAGSGSRFVRSGGTGPKQLTPIAGLPMLQHAINLANELLPGRVYSLLGSNWQSIESQVTGAKTLVNPDWRRGLGNSIACALKHLTAEPMAYDGLLIMLGDQPLLARDKLASMLDLFDGDRAVCASYEGREGVPAVFPPALFADLMTLDADVGAKALLHSLQNKIKVDMPEAAVDIDTLDDLKRLPPW